MSGTPDTKAADDKGPVKAPAPDSPEYLAAMAAKADGTDAPASPGLDAAGKPEAKQDELILGKFKDQKALEDAYKALEQKQSAQPKADDKAKDAKAADAKTDDKAKAPADKSADEEAAKAALNGTGIDYDALSAKYAEKGQLEEGDYKTLADKAGIPRHMVDAFIEGQKLVVQNMRDDVLKSVGGEAEYNATVAWAQKNLSPAEIASFDNLTDLNSIKLAAQGLHARMRAANGSEPKLLNVGGNASGGTTYESLSEMQADMANPKYQTDPAFRDQVAKKLARSNIL